MLRFCCGLLRSRLDHPKVLIGEPNELPHLQRLEIAAESCAVGVIGAFVVPITFDPQVLLEHISAESSHVMRNIGASSDVFASLDHSVSNDVEEKLRAIGQLFVAVRLFVLRWLRRSDDFDRAGGCCAHVAPPPAGASSKT